MLHLLSGLAIPAHLQGASCPNPLIMRWNCDGVDESLDPIAELFRNAMADRLGILEIGRDEAAEGLAKNKLTDFVVQSGSLPFARTTGVSHEIQAPIPSGPCLWLSGLPTRSPERDRRGASGHQSSDRHPG